MIGNSKTTIGARPPVGRAGGLAFRAALVALAIGVAAGPAAARWDDHGGHHDGDRHDHPGEVRGGFHDGFHHGWTGGYRRAPPVIYDDGYGYDPPPVVYAPPLYGPGIGIELPGVSIGIH